MIHAASSLGDTLRARLAAAPRTTRWQFAAHHPLAAVQLAVAKWSGQPREVICPLFFGEEMTVVLPEIVSTELYRHGFFEPDLTETICRLLRPGDVFYDVGTHLGYYSLLASRLVGPTGRVVALEPTSRTRALLERNVAPFTNVEVLPYAAWRETTELQFNDYGWMMSAYNSFSAARLADTPDRITVPARPLDAIVAETGRIPTMLKIDAEAAELYVLQGLRETMATASPLITLETGDFTEGAPKSQEVIAFAMAHGYRPYDLVDGRFVPHQLKRDYGYANILMSKTPLN